MILAHTCCDDYWRPQHDDKAAAGIFVLLTRAAPNGQKKGCDYGSHSNHAATPVPKSVPIRGQVDLRKRRRLDLPAVWVLKKKKKRKQQNSQTLTVLCSFPLRDLLTRWLQPDSASKETLLFSSEFELEACGKKRSFNIAVRRRRAKQLFNV